MKQYLFSVIHTEGEPFPTGDALQAIIEGVGAFNTQLQASGAWVFAGGLFPPDIATVVRVTDGEAVMTDGPFSESKEYIGGFWVIKAPDLDAALELARQGAAACATAVEVRPFQEETDD